MPLTLVLGGTRSGKSAHAEALAAALAGRAGRPVRYLATADPADGSMADRIRAHRARRPAAWETVQAGDDPAAQLAGAAVNLMDGLGVWLAGALARGVDVEAAIERLARSDAELIVVAENAGEGLLPLDAISRTWLDALGAATLRLSRAAKCASYVVAGRAVDLGGAGGFAGAGAFGGPLGGRFAERGGPDFAAAPSPVSEGLRRHGDAEVRPGDLDHAVNVLEPGPPDWLAAVLAAELAGGATRYPREDAATRALAALHGREAEEIVPTNGAAEALWLLGPALRPALAACIHPGFTEAEAGLRAHGISVTRAYRDPGAGFRLDPAAVPEAADLVVVGNPASPSGTLDPRSTLEALRRPGRIVVVDEAFLSMVPGEPGTLIGAGHPDVIVVRSLTKLLSIPGVRAGYAVAPRPLAARLRAVRPPWSANALALAAMAAAAGRPDELAALAERAAAEGADLHQRLIRIAGLDVWDSVTNFTLVRVPDGPRTLARLRAQRFAVRPAGSFPGLDDSFLRLTARDPERNRKLVAAVRQALTML
jgi:histidinol-phosphate/aromatic aminotransferase/cobyric acid decarboxylase-like protein/adenosyl cobinamide kinase/adenosyl cobinamide phosphate guanylyltransferase